MGGDLAPGRAEVDQHRRAILADDDVVGGDVAVQVAGGVHHLERIEQRGDDFFQLRLPRRPIEVLEPGLEAAALLEMQHHVGGLVGPEIAVDAHDVGVHEARERLRLIDEALEAPVVVGSGVAGARRGILAVAGGEIGREVFLDGDETGERDLVGKVGDAEAAGAQYPLDAVVADQLRPVWQGQQVAIGCRLRLDRHSHHGSHVTATRASLPARRLLAQSTGRATTPRRRGSERARCGQYYGNSMGRAGPEAVRAARSQQNFRGLAVGAGSALPSRLRETPRARRCRSLRQTPPLQPQT